MDFRKKAREVASVLAIQGSSLDYLEEVIRTAYNKGALVASLKNSIKEANDYGRDGPQGFLDYIEESENDT